MRLTRKIGWLAGCGLLAALLAAGGVQAQGEGQPSQPVVNSDGSVTVRVRAPNAQNVILTFEPSLQPPPGATAPTFAPRLTKGDDGIWTFTTPPLRPDVYGYRFIVDNSPTLDIGNYLPMRVGAYSSLGLNQVVVPGAPAEPWELTPVPHGAVAEHLFHSEAIGAQRNYFVYTPPGYDPARPKRYPVLYLLHGISDRADTWTGFGHANLILDNLLAQGRIVPFILVTPMSFGDGVAMGPAQGGGLQSRNFETFKTSLLDEIIPQVEKAYNVSPDPQDRAIAGSSMGGAEALWIGLNHPSRFNYVAGFSPAMVMLSGADESAFPGLSASLNAQIKLIYLSCGSGDQQLTGSRALRSLLESKKVGFQYSEPSGAHDYSVWKRNLIDLAPRLFR